MERRVYSPLHRHHERAHPIIAILNRENTQEPTAPTVSTAADVGESQDYLRLPTARGSADCPGREQTIAITTKEVIGEPGTTAGKWKTDEQCSECPAPAFLSTSSIGFDSLECLPDERLGNCERPRHAL